MQTTHEHPIGFGRHDCLPFPPLDCLDEAEIDGGYSVGKYFAIQIGDALVLYSDDGMPTGMSVAEAIAADKMEDAGCDATHVHQFLAEVRHANAESERASRDLADIPTSSRAIGEACRLRLVHQSAEASGRRPRCVAGEYRGGRKSQLQRVGRQDRGIYCRTTASRSGANWRAIHRVHHPHAPHPFPTTHRRPRRAGRMPADLIEN